MADIEPEIPPSTNNQSVDDILASLETQPAEDPLGKRKREDSDDEDLSPAKRSKYMILDDEAEVEDDIHRGSDDEDMDDLNEEDLKDFVVPKDEDMEGGIDVPQKKRPQWKKSQFTQLTREEREMVREAQGKKGPVNFDLDYDADDDIVQRRKGRLRVRQDDPEEDYGVDLAPLPEQTPEYMSKDEEALEEEMEQGSGRQHRRNAESFVVFDDGQEAPRSENLGVITELFGDVDDLIGGGTSSLAEIDFKDDHFDAQASQPKKKTMLYGIEISDEEGEEAAPGAAGLQKPAAADKKPKRKTAQEIRRELALTHDLPERLLDRIKNTDEEQMSEQVLQSEADWILTKFKNLRIPSQHGSSRSHVFEKREEVIKVIKWIREDHLDIPVLFMQQRDYLPDKYNNDQHLKEDLWLIDEYDEKWQILFLRKKALLKLFEQCQERTGNELSIELEHTISLADNQEELDDVQALLNAYGAEEEKRTKQLPVCPNVTCNEALGFDSVDINDGYQRILENIDAIRRKSDETADERTLDGKRQAVKEIEALLAFYTKQRDTGNLEDMFESEQPECVTEEAQEYEGCSLADEDDVEQFFAQMRNKITNINEDIQSRLTEKEAVQEELNLLLVYYQKLAEISQSKQYSGLKKPRKSSRNHAAEFKELKPLIDMVGNVELLGENMRRTSTRFWEDAAPVNEFTVEVALKEFIINSRYNTVKSLKRALTHVCARRIGLEPKIRQEIRVRVLKDLQISTIPTHDGKLRIDWMHPFASVKRLKSKPVSQFLLSGNKQWALIEDAVESNLLKPVIYELEPSPYKRYSHEGETEISQIVMHFMNEMVERFCTRESSGTATEWDELRGDILLESLKAYLQPMAIKYVRKKLLEHAQETIIRESARELREIGSYGYVNATGRTIVACIVGEQQEPTFCVVLDELGSVIKHLQLHFLKVYIKQGPGRNFDQRTLVQQRHQDTKSFKNFIRFHKPKFIAIDASSMQCYYFQKEVRQALTGLGPEYATDIVLVDPCVSRVYKNSDMAVAELESYPIGLRQAVGLGRFCLDPVNEICNLWDLDKVTGLNNILSLPLHPMKKYVPGDKLASGLRTTIIQMVADQGVCLNFMASRPWLRGTLQFVSGFGPERSKEMLDWLQAQTIHSRRDLERSGHRGLLPEKVFYNSSQFLRIEPDDEHRGWRDEEEMISFLDGTLIHPDDAEYAELVICNALDKEPDEYDIDADEATKRRHKISRLNDFIEIIRKKDPNSIENLNLELFAQDMERTQNKKIKHKLLLIKEQVKEYYKDARPEFRNLEEETGKYDDVLFGLLTGESDRSLCVGQMLTCKVVAIKWGGLNLRLDSGLPCWLPARCLNDELVKRMQKIEDSGDDDAKQKADKVRLLEEAVDVGEYITARVIEVEKKKKSVKVSLKEEHMKNTEWEKPPDACKWLVLNHEEDTREAVEKEDRKNAGPIQPFISRQIDFPDFQNVSADDAVKQLQDKEEGSIIIRPSKEGLDKLSLSWKMAHEPDIIVHFHINELDKPNQYALGRKLEIKKEQYDELDELVAEFVTGMNEKKNQITSHDKFKFGTEDDIRELLQDEKAEQPLNIPYFLSYSYKHPGKFLLSYIPNRSVQYEYISLVPKGFRFRGMTFVDPGRLVRWFKQNYQKMGRNDRRNRKRRREESSRYSSSSTSPNMQQTSSYGSYNSSPAGSRYGGFQGQGGYRDHHRMDNRGHYGGRDHYGY